MQPNNDARPRRFFGRPADRSLQAYKDFIRGMGLALNPETKDDMTEEQWRAAWKDFWADASKTPGPNQQ